MDETSMAAAGAMLRRLREREVLDGRLTVTEWHLDVGASDFDHVMVALIASSYISDDQLLRHPYATLANKLPPKGTTFRRGDFGEILAGVLYSQRCGYDVPFQRLEHKPTKSSTMQGTDVLGLCLDYGEEPRPVVVEVKFRTAASPKSDLEELKESLSKANEDYLVSAWVAAVELMEAHKNAEKAFALSAALHMAKMLDPHAPAPEHDRHAVVVAGSGRYKTEKLTEYWGNSPPVSHLHVITVPNAAAVVDRLFDAAAALSYSDAASGVPQLIELRTHRPGLGTIVSSTEAAQRIRWSKGDDLAAVVEAALWMLADWDGMGAARANRVTQSSSHTAAKGLAHLLAGRGSPAAKALKDDVHLAPFVQAVRDAWDLKVTSEALAAATHAAVTATADEPLSDAVRYVGAAVLHRLRRHPAVITRAAGATGPNVRHRVDEMLRYGMKAFWPSQAKAISAGLLDRGQPPMAIKMPTSAGKSLLIELAVADTLDTAADAVAVVLGPTKALVNQLSHGLREVLPGDVSVRSSSGGLDFDLDDVTAGLLQSPGVAVMTPERFDLEWRRTLTGEGGADLDAIKLLVVDEAHHVTDTGRGARLELIIARALRRGIRVILLSSQFPDVNTFGGWLDGSAVETEWSPTWLQRFVYFEDKAALTGYVQAEAGDAVERLKLLKDNKGNRALAVTPAVAIRGRRTEAAALAELHAPDGLVVLYADKKSNVAKLVEAVAARTAPTTPVEPGLEALAAPLDAAEPELATLLRSRVGVHHADIPRAVRHAVETAARKKYLDYLVCTSTLLEGVDFPAATVIAVYPPQANDGRPQVARLRNLAGRAGRGGRFTTGVIVVMVPSDRVRKWLQAFRSELRPTASALSAALNHSRTYGAKLELLELPGDDKFAVLPTVDAVVLAAIIEGAVIDGDLRDDIEEVLGRTLWWTHTEPANRDRVLDAAERRSAAIRRFVGGDAWSASFYRSGLPLASAVNLRDRVVTNLAALQAALNAPSDGIDLLLTLASAIAPAANELAAWQALDPADIQAALRQWVSGEPVDAIKASDAETWEVLEKGTGLDTLLPWVLTAIVDFIATAAGDPAVKEQAHAVLGIPRVRYGVPKVDLCSFARRGDERVTLAEYAKDYDEQERWRHGESLEEYVADRLAAAAAAAEADEEPF